MNNIDFLPRFLFGASILMAVVFGLFLVFGWYAWDRPAERTPPPAAEADGMKQYFEDNASAPPTNDG